MKLDLDKALSHQIVLISGDEDVLRRRALADLVSAAAGDDDFDTEVFTGDSSHPQAWLGSCGTAPFLSPRRVAIVRNLLRFDVEDFEWVKAALPETALLILVTDAETGDDSRQKTFAGRQKKWDNALKKSAAFIYSATISDTAFSELIKQEVAKLDKTIAPTAISALQEMLGGSLSAALEEVEKAALYVGTQSQITERDIRAVVVPAREWNVFRLIDSVFSGRSGDALTQLKILLGGGTKVEGPAYGSVFPMLSRQFKLVWQARAMLDAKASLTSAPEVLRNSFPAKTNLLAQKEYPQKLAMQAAQKVTTAQLQRCFEILVEAECRMKGLMPMFTPSDALEQMVLEMVGTVGAKKG